MLSLQNSARELGAFLQNLLTILWAVAELHWHCSRSREPACVNNDCWWYNDKLLQFIITSVSIVFLYFLSTQKWNDSYDIFPCWVQRVLKADSQLEFQSCIDMMIRYEQRFIQVLGHATNTSNCLSLLVHSGVCFFPVSLLYLVLLSGRQHLSSDDGLEDKREHYHSRSMLHSTLIVPSHKHTDMIYSYRWINALV